MPKEMLTTLTVQNKAIFILPTLHCKPTHLIFDIIRHSAIWNACMGNGLNAKPFGGVTRNCGERHEES